jgi:hypothetical protein
MIRVNVDKAKAIAHDVRRAHRAAEFAPLDIKATIPSEAAAAEAERQKVRARSAAIQAEIDAAKSPEELKAIVVSLTAI